MRFLISGLVLLCGMASASEITLGVWASGELSAEAQDVISHQIEMEGERHYRVGFMASANGRWDLPVSLTLPDGTVHHTPISSEGDFFLGGFTSAVSGEALIELGPLTADVASAFYRLRAQSETHIPIELNQILDGQAECEEEWTFPFSNPDRTVYVLPVDAGDELELVAETAEITLIVEGTMPGGDHFFESLGLMGEGGKWETRRTMLFPSQSGEYGFTIRCRGREWHGGDWRFTVRRVDPIRLEIGQSITGVIGSGERISYGLVREANRPMSLELKSEAEMTLGVTGVARLGLPSADENRNAHLVVRPQGSGLCEAWVSAPSDSGGEFTLSVNEVDEVDLSDGGRAEIVVGEGSPVIAVPSTSEQSYLIELVPEEGNWQMVLAGRWVRIGVGFVDTRSYGTDRPPRMVVPPDRLHSPGGSDDSRWVLLSRLDDGQGDMECSVLVDSLVPEAEVECVGSDRGEEWSFTLEEGDISIPITISGEPGFRIAVEAESVEFTPQVTLIPERYVQVRGVLNEEATISLAEVTIPESGELVCLLRTADFESAGEFTLRLNKAGPRVMPDFALPDIDGNLVRSEDLLGRVLLVNFWGVQCGPCIREMPTFVAMTEKYNESEVRIIGITSYTAEEQRPVADEQGINYSLLVDSDMEQTIKFGELLDAGRLNGIPRTFVIDRDGTVFSTHLGFTEREVFEAEIEDLLFD